MKRHDKRSGEAGRQPLVLPGMVFRRVLRRLRREPLFSGGLVLVLALGMGACAALFTVMRATVLQPLAFANSGDVLLIQALEKHGLEISSMREDAKAYEDRSHTLSEIASYDGELQYASGPAPDHAVYNVSASANLFHLLGVSPARGRFFTAEEDAHASKLAVISHRLWTSFFASDPNVIGRTFRLNDTLYTVIGVMPQAVTFPVMAEVELPQVWTPIGPAAGGRSGPASWASLVARRRPGVSVRSVQRELNDIQQTLRPLYVGEAAETAPARLTVETYRDTLDKRARPALNAIAAAVLVMWLIACASAASLMLARGIRQQREIAIQSALGATRWTLVQQFLAEALLLGIAACAGGIALAHGLLLVGSRVVSRQLGNVPDLPQPTVLFALAVLTCLSVVLFGGIPAMLATSGSLDKVLRASSGRSGHTRAQVGVQRTLVIAELSLTLALLMGCGLLLRTVGALRKVPLGFRKDHVLVVEPELPYFRYRNEDLNRAVYQTMLRRVQQIPGVRSAALTSEVPLGGTFAVSFNMYLSGASQPREITAQLNASSPSLKDVYRFGIAQGRWFTDEDTPTSPIVAVVNRAFLKECCSGDAGQMLRMVQLKAGKDRPIRIVGVTDDLRQTSVAGGARPEIDLDANQLVPGDTFYQPTMRAHIELALRTDREPSGIADEVRTALAAVDPSLRSSAIRTMDQVVDDSIGPQLVMTHLLEGFAILAFVIAVTGLYSLISYTVSTRSRDLAVRLALGAPRDRVLIHVLRGAGAILLAGLLCGVAASLVSVRLLQHFLFQVDKRDWHTLLGALVLLGSSGMIAAYLPARRAAAMDPMQVLRSE